MALYSYFYIFLQGNFASGGLGASNPDFFGHFQDFYDRKTHETLT